jgi:hypothetical protein
MQGLCDIAVGGQKIGNSRNGGLGAIRVYAVDWMGFAVLYWMCPLFRVGDRKSNSVRVNKF